MSDKIGQRPLGPSSGITSRPSENTESNGSGAARGPNEISGARASQLGDSFERQTGALSGAALGGQLQALAKTSVPGKIVFSNEDLAYLANTFAALIRHNAKMPRSKRAKLFTKAILQADNKLSKLLQKVPKEEAEEMFAAIADMLGQSPVLAQLVDTVTDEAAKFNG